jgi:hypothetical protein
MSNTSAAPAFVVTSKRPLASAVRAWGRDNDFKGKTEAMVSSSTKGRLSPVLIAAYNAKHKGGNAYSEKDKAVKSITVKVKPAKGRAKEVRLSVPQARAALAAQPDAKVGERGSLSKAALATLLGGTITG